jgi:predicted DNA-binding protein
MIGFFLYSKLSVWEVRIMRKRNHSVLLRLSSEEYQHLAEQAKTTGLPREVYIRSLIAGYVPKELPPLEYHALLRELSAIGNNLNQIAAQANAVKHIDKTVFIYEANRLRRAVQEIQEAFTAPERLEDGQGKEASQTL